MRKASDTARMRDILLYWYDNAALLEDKCGFLLDIGEPTCFACKNSFNGKYDVVDERTDLYACVKCWEKSPLQRCHILAHAHGGNAAPSNFVLMCEECHSLSPHVTETSILFDWMKSQDWIARRIEGIRQAFLSFGEDLTALTEEHLLCLSRDVREDEFRNTLNRKAMVPFYMGATSAFVGLLLDYHRKHPKNMIQGQLFDVQALMGAQ